MITHIPINNSLLSKPQCSTKSAFDKNLNAKPSSRKPKITLKVFIHLPDFGIEFNILGKKANKVNGSARAIPKPNIPKVNWIAPPCDVIEPTKRDPRIGPVHENETSTNVSAMKNIPRYPLKEFDFESMELIQDAGKEIS